MKKFTDEELEILLNDLEADTTERKRSLKGDTPRKRDRQFVQSPMNRKSVYLLKRGGLKLSLLISIRFQVLH
jgi:hypothetical protein